ncbi:MAG: SDR family oxidoreductase, partial [Clostridiales bacterium]|nr:SDR family oxidoreductase [Clostridiales bacterium]
MKKQTGKDKVAVVTGGSSGIGKELVRNLRNYGYTVVCVSRSAPENGACDFFACDLSDRDALSATAQKITEKYKNVHLLINNAGLGVSGATELLPEESVRYVLEVDYFAPLLFTRALLPAIPSGGKVVMISSACALFALPYRNVYCSAKAALNMLAYGLRMELARSKICVVSICPGDIKSNFTANRLKYT